MLRLAVATDAETLDRMRGPLADRGIEAEHLSTTKRAVPLSGAADAYGDFDVGFVYPSRLMEGGVADAALSIPWLNDREAVLRSRNKAETIARLDRGGVPTPETVSISNPADESALVAAFRRFDPPVVVKPNSTTRGIGVLKATDLDSFLGVCDYLSLVHDYRATGDRSFLVQEYLPEARDYRLMVVGGTCVGGVERRLSDPQRADGRWKHNVHRGAEAVAVDPDPELRSLAESAASTLDIDYLGVDVLRTPDRTVVNETNARPTIDDAEKYDPGFYDDLAAMIEETARS
ncbi:MAG: RimK family alpha-L-glutamate ligase [Natronomonas sp.]